MYENSNQRFNEKSRQGGIKVALLGIALRKNWPVWSVLVFLFLFSGFFGLREFWRWYNLNKDFGAINANIITTQNQTGELKQELDNLNNPVFLEKEARSRLNLKKEGESVLVVVSENNFPAEDFLEQMNRGEFDQSTGFWLNFKNWKEYLFP